MFPLTDFQLLIRALRYRDVPIVDAVDAALNVAKYAISQLRLTAVADLKTATAPMSDEALADCLEKACVSSADPVNGAEAAAVDWKAILSALLKILPLFI